MRRRRVGAAFVVIAILMERSALRVSADVSYTVFEYRVLADLGQVRLTTGFVNAPQIQERLTAQRASFERRGIVFGYVDAERQFIRKEQVGRHSIETTISLYPPVGRGPGGSHADRSRRDRRGWKDEG